jgi:heme exporter protein CcmD
MGASTYSREIVMKDMNYLITWLHMGGYASYIWPAYLSVFAVFMTHFVVVKLQTKRVFRMLKGGMNKI